MKPCVGVVGYQSFGESGCLQENIHSYLQNFGYPLDFRSCYVGLCHNVMTRPRVADAGDGLAPVLEAS